MELDALVLLLHQPYAIFFKKDNRLYIKNKIRDRLSLFPNNWGRSDEFFIRNFYSTIITII